MKRLDEYEGKLPLITDGQIENAVMSSITNRMSNPQGYFMGSDIEYSSDKIKECEMKYGHNWWEGKVDLNFIINTLSCAMNIPLELDDNERSIVLRARQCYKNHRVAKWRENEEKKKERGKKRRAV